MRRIRNIALGALGGLCLTACATAPVADGAPDMNDPLERANRRVFELSLAIDKSVTRPAAVAYRDVVPVNVREMIRNFLNNLNSPSVFANDVLQGEVDRARVTLVRTVVNTGVGAGGIFEVAEGWGFPGHYEDFGQTLAVWGVGEGPYLVIPLIGPSNPRDLAGRGVDFFLDPLVYVEWGDDAYLPYARTGTDVLDLRARNIETLDDIERTSADFYASVRSLYRQARNNEIRNGAAEVEDLPDF